MNAVAIVVAAVVNMALGALWFGPLFGKRWQQLSGVTPSGGAGALYVITGIGALVTATTMAFLIAISRAGNAVEGAVLGLYAGVGFIMPAMFADALFAGRPFGLYLIVAGYPAVALVVMGAIIGAWQ